MIPPSSSYHAVLMAKGTAYLLTALAAAFILVHFIAYPIFNWFKEDIEYRGFILGVDDYIASVADINDDGTLTESELEYAKIKWMKDNNIYYHNQLYRHKNSGRVLTGAEGKEMLKPK